MESGDDYQSAGISSHLIARSRQARRDCPIRRRVGVSRARILFFSANTTDGEHLALSEEYRTIDQRISAATYGQRSQLIAKLAAQ